MELEPIGPETAVELSLADRRDELRQATLNPRRSRLQFLVEWCENRTWTSTDGSKPRLRSA